MVIGTPAARAASSAQRASSGFTSTGMHSSTAMPALCSPVARTNASPPLLPGPAISHTRCFERATDVSRVICSSRKLAADWPARAISVCFGNAAAACDSAIRRSVSVSRGSARWCGSMSVGGAFSASVMARPGGSSGWSLLVPVGPVRGGKLGNRYVGADRRAAGGSFSPLASGLKSGRARAVSKLPLTPDFTGSDPHAARPACRQANPARGPISGRRPACPRRRRGPSPPGRGPR